MMTRKKSHQERRQPFRILNLVVFILIFSCSYIYYKYEKKSIRDEKYADLKMIADLKINQIVNWREERLANARIISESPMFRQKISDCLVSEKLILQGDLLNQLSLMKSSYGYEDVFVVSAAGKLLLGLNTNLTRLEQATWVLFENGLRGGNVFMGEPYFCSACNKIHLDIIAPIKNDRKVPMAVLVLRVNPSDFLYPYIQSWPASSRTAETLILRRDGDSILYVNELRHASNSALNLRIPLTRLDIPAVQAVLGRGGIFEGVDYRGARVLAYLRPVPGTSWFMVAKVDQQELFAELKYRTVVIIVIALLLFLFSGLGISWVYNNRQKNIYRKLLATATALHDSQMEFRTTLYSIGDAVITTDVNGHIRNMNGVAESLTGWMESEACGRPVEEVFCIINEESRNQVESPVQRVLHEGLVVGLANHTLLISKDGKETPIADSGAPIRNEKGEITGAVLVFRDQTRERMAMKSLSESIRLNSSIMQAAQDIIVLKDENFIIRLVNPAMCNLLGKAESEIIGKTDFDLFPYELAAKYRSDDQFIIDSGQSFGYEEEVTSQRGIRYVSTIKAPVLNEHNVVNGIVVIARDITERRQMEELLRKSEKDLRESQRMAHIGSWRLDVATNQVTWTEELYNMYGFDPSLPPPIYAEHIKLFTPESWERLSAAIERTRETGHPYTLELETIRNDGSNGWMWVHGEADVDSNGKIVGLWGAAQDITWRKQADAALRESEEFTRTVLDNLPVGIAVNSVDPEVEFNYMNDSFPEIYRTTKKALARKDSFWEEVYEDPGFREDIKKRVLADCASGDERKMIWEEIPIARKGAETTYVTARNIPIPGKQMTISMVWDVTERLLALIELKRHQNHLEHLVAERTADLKRSEEKFRTMADFAYDWEYWVDADNQMLYVSPSCERLTGFLPDSFYKNPRFVETIIHPDDRQVYEKHVKSFHGGNVAGENSEIEFRIVAKDGHIKWMGHSCAPVSGDNGKYLGRRSSNRDITVTKKAEILARSQRDIGIALSGQIFLRDAFSIVLNAAIEVAGMDCGGIYLFDEKSGAIDLVHYSGLPDDFVAVSSRYEADSPNNRLVMKGQPVYASMPILEINKHEPEQLRAIAIIPMVASGKVIGCMNVASHTVDEVPMDARNGLEVLTIQASAALARIKAEHEISELNEDLKMRGTELEASNKELESFSYSVSHDLRAPLRHVSGYIELLNKQFQTDIPEKGRHYLNAIADSVHVMGALIDDLLQFSRTGRTEMHLSEFDMDEVMKEVIEMLVKDIPDRQINWIAAKLGSITGDKSMLRLVWMNLLSNAVKFTRTRKVAKIEIGVRKENSEVVYFVRDNGVGFDMQYAQKLFGVFQRMHSVEEFEGTGIGLANVHRIVLRHGGRTWAEAEPGKGAVFFFSLPN